MSRNPDVSATLHHGNRLTLTCTIQLHPAVVNSDVVVTGNINGPRGTNSTVTVMSSAGEYRIILEIPSLNATASDTYTCTATVKPGSGVMYVQQSEPNSSSLSITVGKQPIYSC